MTLPLDQQHLLHVSPFFDILHQIPLQLNDYTTFLQQHASLLLLKSPQSEISENHFLEPQVGELEDEGESFAFLGLIENAPTHLALRQAASSASLVMSNSQSTFSSQTFSSSSFSSSSNGQEQKVWSKTESTSTNPSGTTVHRTFEEPGQAPKQETLHYDNSGKALPQGIESGRIEDVTDADREYSERMEDEYAKREGGA